MNINFSWKFHQKVLTLTISFIVLNDSIDIVLIYRLHPVNDGFIEREIMQRSEAEIPLSVWFSLY